MRKPRYLLKLQRDMRRNPTPAEDLLWQHLRNKQLENVRFLRQKAFGRYIVDFYCASAKLVIEIDGAVHDTPEAKTYDAERTSFLNARGLKVIRFQNEQVEKDLASIPTEIRYWVRTRRLPPPTPPSFFTREGSSSVNESG